MLAALLPTRMLRVPSDRPDRRRVRLLAWRAGEPA